MRITVDPAPDVDHGGQRAVSLTGKQEQRGRIFRRRRDRLPARRGKGGVELVGAPPERPPRVHLKARIVGDVLELAWPGLTWREDFTYDKVRCISTSGR